MGARSSTPDAPSEAVASKKRVTSTKVDADLNEVFEKQQQDEADHRAIVDVMCEPKEISSWLLAKANDPVFVSVSNPTSTNKLPFGLKKQTSYEVKSISNSSGEHATSRKMKDFVALRDVLAKRYSGVVPKLPPAKQSKLLFKVSKTKKEKQKFILHRQEGLERFLRACARNPFFRSDSAFLAFAQSQADFMPKDHPHRFEHCGPSASTEVNHSFSDSSSSSSSWLWSRSSGEALRPLSKVSEGELRWQQALHECEIVDSPATFLANAVSELEELHKYLKSTQHAMRQFQIKTSAYAGACREVGDALATWGEFERDALGESTKGKTCVPTVSAMTDLDDPQATYVKQNLEVRVMVHDASKMRLKHADLFEHKIDQIRRTLCDPLGFEISSTEALVVALKKLKPILVARKKTARSLALALENANKLAVPDVDSGLAAPPVNDDEDDDDDDGNDSDSSSSDPEAIEDHAPPVPAVIPDSYDSDKISKLKKEASMASSLAKKMCASLLTIELARFRVERTARVSQLLYESSTAHVFDAKEETSIYTPSNSVFPTGMPATAELQVFGEGALTAHAPRVLLGAETYLENSPSTSFDRRRRSLSLGTRRTTNDSTMLSEMRRDIESPASLPNPPSLVTEKRTSLRALYEFKAEHDDELNVKKGQVLTGKIDEHDPDWYVASDSNGNQGLVPANFVEEVLDDGERVGAASPPRPLPQKSLSPKSDKREREVTPEVKEPAKKKNNKPSKKQKKAAKAAAEKKAADPPPPPPSSSKASKAPPPPKNFLAAIQGFDNKNLKKQTSDDAKIRKSKDSTASRKGVDDGMDALRKKLAARRARVDSDD